MALLSKLEYQNNTKEFRLEEPFDFLIYRPLAYLIVKLTYKMPLNPNHYSFVALIWALVGSYFIAQGEKIDFAVGGVCIVLFSVFDCCDGMIARMKKNGSKWGTQIDMFVDLISNIAIYSTLFIGLKKQNHDFPIEYFSFLCAICILIHASIYHYYKKQFQHYSSGNPDGRIRELNAWRREYDQLKKQKRQFFEKFLLFMFLKFSNAQKSDASIPLYDAEKYTKVNISILPLWAFVAGSSHLTFLSLALMLNEMPIYLYFALVISNLWLLLVYFIQSNVNSSILLKEKVL